MPTLRQALTARLRRWLLGPELEAEIHAAVLRLAATGTEDSAAASTGAAAWRALPGHRLELGDTGFQIELRLNGQHFAYVLTTPEGSDFFAHVDLETCKVLGLRMADQRSQFTAGTTGPRPYGLPRN